MQITGGVRRWVPWLAVIGVVGLPVTARAQNEEMSLLVSAEWLAPRLADPGVVVLHVGRDRAGYDSGHIPGARFVLLAAIVAAGEGVPNELPDVAQLDSVFESVGVSDDSRVVLYGDLGGLSAARAFFTLDVMGVGDHAALLDGGFEVWAAEGRPISRREPIVGRGSLTPRPRRDRVVTADWLNAHVGDRRVVILDARSPREYSGVVAGDGVSRPGHIPGAASLFWRQMLESEARPVLKDRRTLRALFEEAGARPGDIVVTYCRTGVQASHLYFVARLLGYEARMYDASYVEWSGRDSLPVAR